jgi:hypothetical protein
VHGSSLLNDGQGPANRPLTKAAVDLGSRVENHRNGKNLGEGGKRRWREWEVSWELKTVSIVLFVKQCVCTRAFASTGC